LEHAGAFPLPESQLDRFLMRIELGYPDRAAEKKILTGQGAETLLAEMDACMLPDTVLEIQQQVSQVHASDTFLDYLQDMLQFTRASTHFQIGLSPRAGLALLRASSCWAWLHGRDFTLPEDLQHVLPWVVGHRLRTRDERIELPRNQLMDLLGQVPVPL